MTRRTGPGRRESRVGNPAVTMFWIGAATLYLELMLVRWLGCEIPLLAYFKNFPLLAMLAGFSAGCLQQGPGVRVWRTSLWALGAVCLVAALAGPLGFQRLMFPEPALDLWERAIADPLSADLGRTLLHLFMFMALLAMIAIAFNVLGHLAGTMFEGGAPLRIYGANLAGSIGGLGVFAWLSFAGTAPPVWIAVGAGLMGIVASRSGIPLRRVVGPLLLVTAAFVVSVFQLRVPGATLLWSPYYRIEVRPVFDEGVPPELLRFHTTANHDGEQDTFDLSVGRPARDPGSVAHWRLMFDLPFLVAPATGTVLIGGAGTGNDVAAALRHGATSVIAAEIDPGYIEVGRRFNRERPYQSPRVTVVNNDVREVLRRRPGPYDVVVFSILDSSTALSSLGSLRLDNYVYTVESIREAAGRLSRRGVMCVSFFLSGKPGDDRTWIAHRIDRIVRLATGRAPLCTRHGERGFFLFGPGLDQKRFGAVLARQGLVRADYSDDRIRPSTDDWPFLYSNPRGQPAVYWLALGLLVLAAAAWFRRTGMSGPIAGPDVPMVLLGAGFMLVEVKAFTELSLLFGATWVVTAAVLAGALSLAFAANAAARHWPSLPAMAPLLASLAAWGLLPHAVLAGWPRPFSQVLGVILALLPVLFGGLLFSRVLATRREPRRAFAANLLGMVVGGALEASSLAYGFAFLTWLAAALYAASAISEPGAVALTRPGQS